MKDMYQHQIDFLAQNPAKSALVWSCGTGKTRASLEWTKQNDGAILVVCPKPLTLNWRRETEKWGVYAIIMSKEEFRKNSPTLGTFDQLIVDEVHNGFLTPHFKSQMSKALRNYIKKHDVKRVLLLSATVYSSSPWNIYTLAELLGVHWNWQAFSMTFFNQVRFGRRIVPVPKKGCENRLSTMVKQIASVVDISECMDVPEQSHLDPEYFKLTREQERAIKAAYDPLPIVRYTMQHEIENGILLGNEFKDAQTFSADKTERIIDLCMWNAKIAVVCRYNNQIDMLNELLIAKGKKPIVINGKVKNRDAVTKEAEDSQECIVLIQADCAEGYQLPSFPLCVFASQSYSYVKWEQICGRFLRMDKPSKTAFMYLLTEGDSIDQAVYDSVKKKENFRIELYKK